jgi:hypothetical protein
MRTDLNPLSYQHSLSQREDGSFVSATPDLLSTWQTFYKDLFTASVTDEALQDPFLEHLEQVLLPQEKEAWEDLLTMEESLSALKGMANNKTPGIDGLSKEFYINMLSGILWVRILSRSSTTPTLLVFCPPPSEGVLFLSHIKWGLAISARTGGPLPYYV